MTIDHLDDVALSAAIDAEATAEQQAHLATCAPCRRRASAFRAVAQAVAAPVTPRSAADVTTAIEAAIAAADVHPTGVQAAGRGPGRARGEAWAGRGFLGKKKDRAGGQRQPADARRLLAAAAVVVAVLGAAGVVGLVGRGSGSTSAKLSVGARLSPAAQPGSSRGSGAGPQPGGAVAGANAPAAASGATGLAPAGPAVVGPDLGAQQDPAVVARLVDRQLASSPTASAQVPSAAAQGSGGGQGPSGDSQGLRAGGQVSPAGGEAQAAPLPCTAQGATAAGITGPKPSVRYAATLRWKGVAAMVLVYDRPGGGLAGVIVRRSDCAPLAVLPV